MKNFILSTLIILLSLSLSAQTLKVSYKSHSGSLTAFTLSNKNFGLPGDMSLYKIKKVEEQTVETKSIQPLETPLPKLKKLKLTDKEITKKQLKAKKKAAKKKRKAIKKSKKNKKAAEQKSVSKAAFFTENSTSNQTVQLLLLSLLVIVFVVALLPVSKKR